MFGSRVFVLLTIFTIQSTCTHGTRPDKGYHALENDIENIDRYFKDASLQDKIWEGYKSKYGKNYSEKEEMTRKEQFIENVEIIIKHNEKFHRGKETYKMGVNQFTDMSYAEFIQQMTGYAEMLTNVTQQDDYNSTDQKQDFSAPGGFLPQSVDWRKKGYVTAVKNQKACGSCWAFGATGSLEGQHFRKTGKLVSLSEQNLVDCSQKNNGCHGGVVQKAYRYVITNKGIDTESSYPYHGKRGPCTFNKSTVGATARAFRNIKPKSESDLGKAVATIGPVAVAIHVGQTFQHYHSGIYNDPNCSPKINHAVLVVGYGSLSGMNYWIVKNSWGAKWGDHGYINMRKDADNQCGIASQACYPLV